MGGSADRTLQVAAYPTMGGKFLNRHRKPAVANPSFRNLTPKLSMASDITHVSQDRSWLIWSDDNGVCKIYPSWRRFRACEMHCSSFVEENATPCHSEPFAVILSAAKDLALPAQGK